MRYGRNHTGDKQVVKYASKLRRDLGLCDHSMHPCSSGGAGISR